MASEESRQHALDLQRPVGVAAAAHAARGAVVSTEDGLLVAAQLPEGYDAEALAGAAAALGELAQACAGDLGRDGAELMVLDGTKMRFAVRPVGVGYLMVLGEPESDMADIASAMHNAGDLLDRATATLTSSAER